ncbi:MAG TPA: hypothetical protein EYP56_05725 [Planctomycetaceae bacterium]|nr:hypothetical protein [Planctomycetaceae bacterium]
MSTIDQALIRVLESGAPGVSTGQATEGETGGAPAGNQSVDVDSRRRVGRESGAERDQAHGQPVESSFQPAYQVDAVVWPSPCTKLGLQAGGELEQLVEQLQGACDQGHRVIAFTACGPGQGCTTVLLCAARRLGHTAGRVAVVDADWGYPQLAERLGLLPETGWGQVLDDRLPLWEAAIESARDRLAIVPLRPARDGQAASAERYAELAGVLAELRKHYDLVLVDLGAAAPQAMAAAAPRSIDAVVVVHDVRSTSEAEVAQRCQQIGAAGFVAIGVIENFLQQGDSTRQMRPGRTTVGP